MRAIAALGLASIAAPASASPCSAELDEIASFYEAVAADVAASPKSPGMGQAFAGGMFELPVVDAPPSDATHADLLFVGKQHREELAIDDGQLHPVVDDLFGDGGPILVAFDADVAWRDAAAVIAHLRGSSVALVYRTLGVRAHRASPKVDGAGSDHVDIALILRKLDADTTKHCPAYARAMAHPPASTADELRALAGAVRTCGCDVDRAQLELMPRLLAPTLYAVVPAVAGAPAIRAKPGATFGDVVKANGGKPLVVAPPPRLK